jgi:DNA repair protein RadC
MAQELAADSHLEAPAIRPTMSTSTTHAHQVAAAEPEEEVILRALRILRARLKQRDVFSKFDAVKNYLRLQAQGLKHEVFAVMYLDAHNRLLEYERLFRGSLTQTAVYPREVVKQALTMNAASVVLHHNHPGGACRPSRSDEMLSRRLTAALALIDVRVLDHVITSDEDALSMAEQGLL